MPIEQFVNAEITRHIPELQEYWLVAVLVLLSSRKTAGRFGSSCWRVKTFRRVILTRQKNRRRT